jgi:hypothetical protein
LYNILVDFGLSTIRVRLIKTCLNETYSKLCIGKHLPDNFPSQNGLNQGDVLSPPLFKFALEYAISKVQESKKKGLQLNRTHQLLVYANDVDLLGDNIDNHKKNTGTLIDTSNEVGLEVMQRKLGICCCLVTRTQGKIITLPASFCYLCSLIPHHMPATHSLDLSPLHVGSLPNTPLHFFPIFFLDQQSHPFWGPF